METAMEDVDMGSLEGPDTSSITIQILDSAGNVVPPAEPDEPTLSYHFQLDSEKGVIHVPFSIPKSRAAEEGAMIVLIDTGTEKITVPVVLKNDGEEPETEETEPTEEIANPNQYMLVSEDAAEPLEMADLETPVTEQQDEEKVNILNSLSQSDLSALISEPLIETNQEAQYSRTEGAALSAEEEALLSLIDGAKAPSNGLNEAMLVSLPSETEPTSVTSSESTFVPIESWVKQNTELKNQGIFGAPKPTGRPPKLDITVKPAPPKKTQGIFDESPARFGSRTYSSVKNSAAKQPEKPKPEAGNWFEETVLDPSTGLMLTVKTPVSKPEIVPPSLKMPALGSKTVTQVTNVLGSGSKPSVVPPAKKIVSKTSPALPVPQVIVVTSKGVPQTTMSPSAVVTSSIDSTPGKMQISSIGSKGRIISGTATLSPSDLPSLGIPEPPGRGRKRKNEDALSALFTPIVKKPAVSPSPPPPEIITKFSDLLPVKSLPTPKTHIMKPVIKKTPKPKPWLDLSLIDDDDTPTRKSGRRNAGWRWCNVCVEKFKDEASLDEHKRREHRDTSETPKEGEVRTGSSSEEEPEQRPLAGRSELKDDEFELKYKRKKLGDSPPRKIGRPPKYRDTSVPTPPVKKTVVMEAPEPQQEEQEEQRLILVVSGDGDTDISPEALLASMGLEITEDSITVATGGESPKAVMAGPVPDILAELASACVSVDEVAALQQPEQAAAEGNQEQPKNGVSFPAKKRLVTKRKEGHQPQTPSQESDEGKMFSSFVRLESLNPSTVMKFSPGKEEEGEKSGLQEEKSGGIEEKEEEKATLEKNTTEKGKSVQKEEKTPNKGRKAEKRRTAGKGASEEEPEEKREDDGCETCAASTEVERLTGSEEEKTVPTLTRLKAAAPKVNQTQSDDKDDGDDPEPVTKRTTRSQIVTPTPRTTRTKPAPKAADKPPPPRKPKPGGAATPGKPKPGGAATPVKPKPGGAATTGKPKPATPRKPPPKTGKPATPRAAKPATPAKRITTTTAKGKLQPSGEGDGPVPPKSDGRCRERTSGSETGLNKQVAQRMLHERAAALLKATRLSPAVG